jgi:hypothetical protein
MPSDQAVNGKPDLSPKQRAFADAFVRAKIEGLDLPHYDLARAAGYLGSQEALRVSASRTLAHPKVRAYIRDRAREHMIDGGMDVAVTLVRLTRRAKNERVQLDAAKALGASIGMTVSEEGGGPGVVLNLMFAGTGAALVQQPGDAAQVIENAAQSRAARSLVQGEGRRPAVRMVTAPPLALAHAQGGVGGGGGDFAPAAEVAGGLPSYRPPQTVGVVEGVAPKISGPAKPAKSVGVAKKRTAKGRKKARVVRKPKGKSDV